ncbi:Outer membrane lipoprotein Omp16 [Roseibaca ekhonensis]|uniref:Outer membrane lipoprotein Omp16 n=1 Tax=Roseinatronobacter ekhonensis TaxID=254356 RepID=A0A3B0MB02_9RHOB|nr:OmpA family protein [Roseibaca ekhonensis]SUZ33032.1 Outer membrane lipoprotein Omp16 [Roseibaca ekhonensis]
MAVNRRFFLLGSAGLGLSACGGSFHHEAGIGLDEGGFGNPTMHNHLVQTGKISLAEIMTRRFHDEVPSMVNFDFDSAALSAEAKSTLRIQADWMKQFPELRYTIYGHTDAVGSNASNKRLGLHRARAVRRYLVSLGVPHRSIIAVVSRGENQPLIVSEGREPANRRTVTEISGSIRRGADMMNGEYARVIQREYVASATEQHNTATD